MSQETINVERVKAQRAGHRGYATKLTNEARALLEDDANQGTVSRARNIIELLRKRIEIIGNLDEIIVNHVEIEDVEQEVFETSELEQKLNETLQELNRFVNFARNPNEEIPVTDENNSDGPPISPPSPVRNQQSEVRQEHNSIASAPKVRLPKITLPRFKGEMTKFTPFWDVFESNIHNNVTLSTVDKFTYFKSCLEGEAARAVEGISVTDANYNIAIDIIKQRYGNKQQLISAHMDELLKLPSCNEKLSQLKYVYDKINVHVRGLNALGVDSDKYGSLLIPIIMSRIPREISVQVARIVAKEVWNIEDVLEVLRAEVEAREMSESIRVKSENQQASSTAKKTYQPSASALFVKAKQTSQYIPTCVFCNEEHYSAECKSVQDVDERRKILRKNNRCFSCLKVGHRAANCQKSRSCRVCSGQHHQSICNNSASTKNAEINNKTNNNEITSNTTTTVANSRLHVVLQTARAIVTTPHNSKHVQGRILFDSGSQRSYITENLRQKLKAPAVATETLNLNTFGDKGFTKRKCDVVELSISKNGNAVNI